MTIRDAVLSDANEIARLTVQLGYAAEPEVVAGRLSRIARQPNQLLLVAVLEGKVVGWLQAHAAEALESGFRVEIVGLIVGDACRRRGAGRRLVERAEQWANGIGAEAIVVRSNTRRVESHRFYPALGYSLSKTQAVYRKPLKPAPRSAAP